MARLRGASMMEISSVDEGSAYAPSRSRTRSAAARSLSAALTAVSTRAKNRSTSASIESMAVES